MQLTKFTIRPAATAPARFFHQSTRVAQNQEHPARVEDATESTETPNSAGETLSTESSSESSSESRLRRSPDQEFGLFISNISFDVTDAQIEEAFKKFGELTSWKVGRDARGLSRG
jgi:nucleolin